MAEAARGVSAFEHLEALIANPALYELAAVIPAPDAAAGGRPRIYPTFMILLYETLVTVYGSARQVEAELSHPDVWGFVRRKIAELHPEIALPTEPMRRHHYLYARNRYLADPSVFERLAELHRRVAARQAKEIGLLDPDGAGSFTHPDSTRLIYGDGKVITPLYRAKPGDQSVDKRTGEIKPKRFEPDAALHFEGTGETAWGTKFVLVAARGPAEHSRMILDVEFVMDPGAEAHTVVGCITRLAPDIPAHRASSTTPRSAAFITRLCSENSVYYPSTALPPRRPDPRGLDAPRRSSGSRRRSTSRTRS